MSDTGTAIVQASLREIGILDPVTPVGAEQAETVRQAANDLLGTWQRKRLLITGVTIASYNLVSGTQSYTIGSGGTFNQTRPESILAWSVVPDDDATDPVEIPMGRPLTSDEWQAIAVKSSTGAYPTSLYYDGVYAAGLGNILVYPIPDNNDVDIKLYERVPQMTSLVLATTYDLQPGMARLLKLGLAIEIAPQFGRQVSADLREKFRDALSTLQVANIVPREASMRPEFAIGGTGAGVRSDIKVDG